MYLFGERKRLHTKWGTNVQQEKFMFFAEKTTNYHPTTQTDLHPIPKARIIPEPIPKQSVCWLWHTWNKGPTCGGMCDVMCCCCCEERARVWRNVKTGGAKAGCTGIQGGTEWGKGGERPKREKGSHTVCQSQTTWANAKCLPVTARSVKQVITLRRDTFMVTISVLSPNKTLDLGEGYKKMRVTVINCTACTKSIPLPRFWIKIT